MSAGAGQSQAADEQLAQQHARQLHKLLQGPSQRWPEWAEPAALQVQAVAQTASTNSDLLEAARQGRTHPQLLLALTQTQGRGRQGRHWQSKPGHSLTFSLGLVLRPRQGWGALSLVVGHAVASVLQPWPQARPPQGARLMLKWPNDLWWFDQAPQSPDEAARGRKLGGILIETLPLPAQVAGVPEGARWVVVGVGLNVQRSEAPETTETPDAPEPLRDGMAWADEIGQAHSALEWWKAIVPELLRAVADFEGDGAARVLPALEARELQIGQPLTLEPGPPHEGVGLGLDADGALRVQTDRGVHRVTAGEVRVRPRSSVPPSAA